jgi:sugar diacid utilization regulator/putative methionine-R-sulfoxide reductase with GAF domain
MSDPDKSVLKFLASSHRNTPSMARARSSPAIKRGAARPAAASAAPAPQRGAAALAAIGTALAAHRDHAQLLGAVIEHACAAIEASGGGFMRYDAESEELVLKAPAFGVQAEEVVSRYRVRVADGGNAARVFASREPSLTNDAQHDPRFIQRFVRLFDTHNTITVPLVLNDRTLGIFHAINKRDGDFTPDDAAVLAMLAPLLATTLELVDLQRGVARKRAHLARGQEIHERLLAAQQRAAGVEALCAVLHGMLNRPLLLLDNLRRPLASLGWPLDPAQVAHALGEHALRDGRAVSLTLPAAPPRRVTAIAIALAGERAGILLLAVDGAPLDDVETRAAEQGASLLALEFLHQRALAATANQVANAALLELFDDGISSAHAARLLARLDITSRAPWRVLLLELRATPAGDVAPALSHGSVLREALERSLGSLRSRVRLLHWRDHLVVITDEAGAERITERGQVRRLQQAVDGIEDLPARVRLRIGIGRAEHDAAQLGRSLKSAEQALRALERLPQNNATMKFEELGVYRLLLGGNQPREHDNFVDEVLAPVLRSDARGALLETLAALLAHNFNLAAVARELGVHQNTVKYRMQQLREAFGRDPSRGDLRLEIELALKIRLMR